MKDYFTRLFGYDRHMNLLLTKLMVESGAAGKPVQLMAHLLTAQQVWLARCEGKPALTELWPDWPLNTLEQIINDNYNNWVGYLRSVPGPDFERLIPYQNTKGEGFATRLDDIITQVTNHGTHHRAQIGQHLAHAGVNLPYTDYIVFIRQMGS